MSLGAVIFGFLGQYSLQSTQQHHSDAAVFYAMSAILFLLSLFAAGDLSIPSLDHHISRRHMLSAVAAHPFRTILVLASAATAYVTYRTLSGKPGNASHFDALALWVLTGSLYLAAFIPLSFHAAVTRWIQVHRREVAFLVVLTLIAAGLRFVGLGAMPNIVSGDEGRIGSLALNTVTGQTKNMFATTYGHSTLYLFIMALPYHVFGVSPTSLRVLSAVVGTLTVPATYLLARRMFGVREAAIAAVVLLASHFHLHFSRVSVAGGIMDAFFATMAYLFFYGGLKHRRPFEFVLCGLTVGFHLYIYMGGRLMALTLPAMIVVLLLLKPKLVRENIGGLLACLAGFLLVSVPMILWATQHPQEFMDRANQTGIVQNGWLAAEVKRTGLPAWHIILGQFGKSLLIFNYYRSTLFYNSSWPMLDYMTSILFIFGVVYSCVKIKDDRFVLLYTWFFSTIVVGQTLLLNPEQSAYRIIMIIPAAIIFASIGLCKISYLINYAFPRFRNLSITVIFISLLNISLTNINYYFADFSSSCQYEDKYTRVASIMGQYLGTLDRDHTAYLYGNQRIRYGIHPSVDFLSGKLPVRNIDTAIGGRVDFVEPHHKPVFLFVPERLSDAAQVVQAFPGGKWTTFYDCEVEVLRAYVPSWS
jgi:4-amino-4-deoxy-L-arabinose transferase-like glycosyltransferase